MKRAVDIMSRGVWPKGGGLRRRIAVLALSLGVVGSHEVHAQSTPNYDMLEAGLWLRDRANQLVRASARGMSDGRTAFVPQASGGYNGFWLRDYAYMLEGSIGAFSNVELQDSLEIFVDALRADAAGVDTIELSGNPIYMPGWGTMGSNPVSDGSQFTVAVAWHTHRRLNDLALLEKVIDGQPLVDRLVATMNAIPRSANRLVFINPALPWDRAPYGFMDTVRQKGEVLFSSLLDVQASRQLADLLEATGRGDAASHWRSHADTVAAAIRSTFWDESIRLFRAATVQCREPDIWGSAFAVHLGVATEQQADAIAGEFRDQYSGIVQAGQIRHLPAGMYWEVASTRDSYQNGAYWPVATGWFAKTLARVEPIMAENTYLDLVDDFRTRGVNEWVIGSTVGVPQYTASATVPWGMLQEVYDFPNSTKPKTVGQSMGAGNLALAGVGSISFSKDALEGNSSEKMNDGSYGNDSSWVSESKESFVGVAFTEGKTIASIAFGRDNGGESAEFQDCTRGIYTLQYTRVANPDENTPDADWTTLATYVLGNYYPDATPHLRHSYDFVPVNQVTGIRLLTSAWDQAVAIDELEVYGPPVVGPFVNGSFEAPGFTLAPKDRFDFLGIHTLTQSTEGGWTFTGTPGSGIINLHNGNWFGGAIGGQAGDGNNAFEGSQWLSMNGGGATAGGSMSQTFATIAGAEYQVEFAIAYVGGAGAQQRLIAEVFGASDQLLASTTRTATRHTWVTHSFNFVADGPVTTLVLTDGFLSGTDTDLFLDAVSVVAVSLPDAPLPQLKIATLNQGQKLRFTWDQPVGKTYELLSSRRLDVGVELWEAVAGGLESGSYEMDRPADSVRFFTLREAP
jgi:hypothetical protein